jgi:hypothetical protein
MVHRKKGPKKYKKNRIFRFSEQTMKQGTNNGKLYIFCIDSIHSYIRRYTFAFSTQRDLKTQPFSSHRLADSSIQFPVDRVLSDYTGRTVPGANQLTANNVAFSPGTMKSNFFVSFSTLSFSPAHRFIFFVFGCFEVVYSSATRESQRGGEEEEEETEIKFYTKQ